MFEYNFLDNNFTTYENITPPKIELNKEYFPLLEESDLDISNWAVGTTKNGDPIVKDNISEFKPKIENTEEYVPKTQVTPLESPSIKTPQEISTNIKDKEKRAMEFFMSNGLTKHQAAGIVGNLIIESRLKTDAVGDGGKAKGIAQWHPDRYKGLVEYAKSKNKSPLDFDTQLEYILIEINGSQKAYKVLEKLNNSKNADEAAKSFMEAFERPSKNPKVNGIVSRIQHARRLSI